MEEINTFIEHLRLDLNYSERTIFSYKTDIICFNKYIASVGVGFNDVNPSLIREFLSKELEEGKTKKRPCRRRSAVL